MTTYGQFSSPALMSPVAPEAPKRRRALVVIAALIVVIVGLGVSGSVLLYQANARADRAEQQTKVKAAALAKETEDERRMSVGISASESMRAAAERDVAARDATIKLFVDCTNDQVDAGNALMKGDYAAFEKIIKRTNCTDAFDSLGTSVPA